MKYIVMYVIKELSGYKVDFQQLVFEKVLGHLIMKVVFPIYSNLMLSWIATQYLKCIYFLYCLLVQIPYIYILEPSILLIRNFVF
jgi:hypothetical protein